MESLISDLQASRGQVYSHSRQDAGDLWIEVNRLKRGGQQVRQIEWMVSELEGLRGSPDEASAKRHILNNLELEMSTLQRRLR